MLRTVFLLLAIGSQVSAQGNPNYLLRIPDAVGTEARVLFTYDGIGVAVGSFAVCHDPSAAELISVEPGADLPASDFLGFQMFEDQFSGFSTGFLGGGLSPGSDLELLRATYLANFYGASTPLEFCNTIGSPLVDTVLILSDQSSATPTTQNGTLTFATPFVRGDGNRNGNLGIDDVLVVLEYLFLGGASSCLHALDSNADDVLSIVDPLYALQYLFLGAPPPAIPFPDCGTTMQVAELSCDRFDFCVTP